MASPRTRARIEARIRERAAYCLEFELNDPRSTFITVTRVEVSPDLSSAKIFYSVLGDQGERSKASHMLADATGFIRKQVGRVLRMRRIPRMTWFYDEKIEYQAEMEEKIAAALNRDRTLNPRAHASEPKPASETGSRQKKEAEASEEREDAEGDPSGDSLPPVEG